MTCKHLGLRSVGRLPILALLLVALATAPAKAQTIRDWIDPAGGNYDDIANWSALNVPNTISESARFNIVGTYDVVQSPFLLTTVSDLLVNNGDVTFRPSNLFQANFNTDDDASIIGGDLTLAKLITSSVTLNVGDVLEVRGGGTLNVLEGSDVTAASLDLALFGANTGTMLVDGVGSSLTVGTQTRIGFSASTGTLTFQNGSTGNSLGGTVDLMANSAVPGSTGRINVLSGSTLQTGSIEVGRSNSPTFIQEGTLTVDAFGSTLTMTGASALTIGDDINPNVVSDVIVSNSAVMSTGTGAILIQNSGHLDILGGSFNANSNLTVDGGTITRGSNGFNLAAGLTLTAQNSAQINFDGIYNLGQGTTFDIQSGSDFVTTRSLSIGNLAGNGTLVVDGIGSSVTAGGVGTPSFWGLSGSTADVTFRNNASGTLGVTHIAAGSAAGATGILTVESGATVTTNSLSVTFNGGATTSGTITVDGAGSSVTQNGVSSLTVGHATSGTATINVKNDGTFTTGSGTTTVNATGSINIGMFSGGTFNANGNVNVDGGTIMRGFPSEFNLASGLTLTARNDAQIIFSDKNSGNSAYIIDQGTTFDIQSGADLTIGSQQDNFRIGSLSNLIGDGDGTLLVDGVGSSVTAVGFSFWGGAGNTADVTFRNEATGNLEDIDLAVSSTNGTTGIFRIESGATVTTDGLLVATSGGATTSGTLTVDGVGSSLTQNGGFGLTVGHATEGTATITVQNGGAFTTGTGQATVDATGTININTDGTFNALGNISLAGTINLNGGTLQLDSTALTVTGSLNYVTGTLHLRDVGGYTVGANSGPIDNLLGGSHVNLFNGKGLIVEESLTIPAATSLTVNAGSVTANTMVNNGLVFSTNSTVTTTGGLTNNADIILIDATVQGPLNNAGGSTTTVLGTVEFNGLVSGPGNFFGPGTANFNGGYTPGASPAIVNFGGSVNLGTGNTLFMEVGGLLAGTEFDVLDIASTLTVGGTLDLALINGFAPSLGDTFQFLAAGSRVGEFSSVLGTDLGGGLAFDVLYGLNGVTLEVISAALIGDLDGDGFVGINDLNIVLGNWNQNVPPANPLADPSGDGFVGIDDLNAVLGNWNAGTPPGESSNIPEPASLVLLAISGLSLVCRNRGRRAM